MAGSYFIDPSYKFGFSVLNGKITDHVERTILGRNGALGYNKVAYGLGELDAIDQKPENAKKL